MTSKPMWSATPNIVRIYGIRRIEMASVKCSTGGKWIYGQSRLTMSTRQLVNTNFPRFGLSRNTEFEP